MNDPIKQNSSNSKPNLPQKETTPWIIICFILALASVLYRLLVLNQKEQTSLLFIGIPLFLAIGLSMTPRPKSATGVIMKGITLAMLLFGVLFIEGFICILVASPLFFLIGWLIGLVIDRNKKTNDPRLKCTVIGVIFFMSFEGVVDWLSFDREEVVTITSNFDFSAQEAHRMLAKGPDLDLNELPSFLKLGFPLPQSIEGDGVEVGDEWIIKFAGGEGKPGDLIVKVASKSAGSITFSCEKDSSHIAHWMDWKTVQWRIETISSTSCSVHMQIEYTRLLDPAWYFKPVERYGVQQAAKYFMNQTFNKN